MGGMGGMGCMGVEDGGPVPPARSIHAGGTGGGSDGEAGWGSGADTAGAGIDDGAGCVGWNEPDVDGWENGESGRAGRPAGSYPRLGASGLRDGSDEVGDEVSGERRGGSASRRGGGGSRSAMRRPTASAARRASGSAAASSAVTSSRVRRTTS